MNKEMLEGGDFSMEGIWQSGQGIMAAAGIIGVALFLGLQRPSVKDRQALTSLALPLIPKTSSCHPSSIWAFS
jgi:hypothetical protein